MRKTVITVLYLFVSLVFTGNYIHAESSLPESRSSNIVDDQKTKTGDADEKAAENRSDSDSLTLLFMGDIMGHTGQIRSALQPDKTTYDYTSCFDYIRSYISSADLAIANLEVTLAGPPYTGYPRFSSPDALAAACKDAGIDVLVTANNHSVDRGKKGIERTIKILDRLNILHTGTFLSYSDRKKKSPLIIEKNNFRIALITRSNSWYCDGEKMFKMTSKALSPKGECARSATHQKASGKKLLAANWIAFFEISKPIFVPFKPFSVK